MLIPALYYRLEFFKFSFWSYYVDDFSLHFILDASYTYKKLATLLSRNVQASSHKLDFDIHHSDQACQSITPWSFFKWSIKTVISNEELILTKLTENNALL